MMMPDYSAKASIGFPKDEVFKATLTNTLESERYDTVEAAMIDGDASPFDVHDIEGNVQEWTSSIYTPMIDEIVPQGKLYVSREGSFNETAYGARTS